MKVFNSYVYTEGVTPQTRTVIGSRIKMYSFAYGQQGFTQIAVVDSVSQSHGRSADPIRGIGFGDQIAELVPGVSDAVTLSFSRTALYTSNIFQVFGYKGGVDGLVRSLKHHRFPFDIREEKLISQIENREANTTNQTGLPLRPSPNGVRALITRFVGCWMTSFSTDFASDSSIVSENAEVSATDILAQEAIADYNEAEGFGNNPFDGETSSFVLADNTAGT
jgi:hypothetical protein